jgi:cobalt-zinc-cadmium efflux system outer membrane protein
VIGATATGSTLATEDKLSPTPDYAVKPPVAGAGLSYEAAVTEGLRQNLDLIASKYNIPIAEADELTAGLWENPSLQIGTNNQPFGKNWDQSSVGGPREYDFAIQQPLDLSGKHSSAAKSAHEATRVAQATFQDAVRQKVLQIRLGYIDVQTAKQQLALAMEKEEDLRRLLGMIRNRIGNKNLLPLVQRRALLASSQAALNTESRKIALEAANTALALLLNRPPVDGTIDATTKLRDFSIVKLPSVDVLISTALEKRPDLEALRLTVSKADADIEVAHAQVWDDFQLGVGLGLQSAQSANANTAENPGAVFWQASLQIPLPVLNRNQGNIKKAILTREQADKQIQSLAQSIRQEIDSSYDQLELNQHLIQEYETTQLDNARKVHDAEQSQFGTGNSALLDYFDAMGAYYDTLTAYYDALGEYRRSVARMQASVGKDVL